MDIVQQMTKPNPNERATIKQVRDHPFFKGQPAASTSEMLEHFYSLKGVPSEEDIKKNEEARENWGKVQVVNRSKGVKQFGPEVETMKDWAGLEYKQFNMQAANFARHNGFFSKTSGANLFSALWEYLAEKYGSEDNSDACEIETVSKFWKMKVSIKVPQP